MSKVVRSVKNVTKGYSAVEVKVRNGKKLQHMERTATDGHSDQQRSVGSGGLRHGGDCPDHLQQVCELQHAQ
jgi:hypothetical protein